jgi:hypothetical protein
MEALLWELVFLVAAGVAVRLLILQGVAGEVSFFGRFL